MRGRDGGVISFIVLGFKWADLGRWAEGERCVARAQAAVP